MKESEREFCLCEQEQNKFETKVIVASPFTVSGLKENCRCTAAVAKFSLHSSPEFSHFLNFLKDVGGDDGAHDLNCGHDSEQGDPDDLVLLEPVEEVVLAGGLLHPPGGVLTVPLPAQ